MYVDKCVWINTSLLVCMYKRENIQTCTCVHCVSLSIVSPRRIIFYYNRLFTICTSHSHSRLSSLLPHVLFRHTPTRTFSPCTYRDVSNVAMRNHDVSGLWKLSLLTSMLAMIPMCFLWLLPQNADEQAKLAECKDRSRVGGAIFLCVLFGSLTWTISEAVMELVSV
jgi:hypothetical protein